MSRDEEFFRMMKLLAQIDSILPEVVDWKPEIRPDMPSDARAFVGTAKGWKFVVVDFDITNQGFPPGSRGYDGAATNPSENVVIHLTRELAEKALGLILRKISN